MEELLQDWIFPKTIGSGCFGENAELENFVIEEVDNTGDHFASELLFVRLFIRSNNEDVKTYDVVVKIQLNDKNYRDIVNMSMQFRNEVHMYKTVLPMLNRNNIVEEIFCKYYYSYLDPNDPKKDFIVIEDLRKQGYRLPKEKVCLDFEHCAVALKEIGRFHALSYIQKAKDGSKLFSVVEKFEDRWTPETLEFCQDMIESCGKRGIQPLIDQGESLELLQSLLHEYENVPKFFSKLIAPIEPEAVICHGDFNRNNLLFKYDENQHVTGIKMIDLQTPRYSSPVIDVSFLIFMNMSRTLRAEHLNDLLDIYNQSLFSTVENSSLVPDIDFSRRAIYGYIICSFFLPVMMAEKLTVKEVLGQGPDEGVNFASKRGGQKETQALVDIVRDMLKFGYIKETYD